jgi:ribosomal protein L34E
MSTLLHTGRASLCALGEYLRRQCFFAPLREQRAIVPKTVRYRPVDMLLDALVGILCGAKTIAQSNVTIRTSPGCGGPLATRRVPTSRPLRARCAHAQRRMSRSLNGCRCNPCFAMSMPSTLSFCSIRLASYWYMIASVREIILAHYSRSAQGQVHLIDLGNGMRTLPLPCYCCASPAT